MATATDPPLDATTLEPRGGEALYEVVDGQVVEKPPMGAYSTWIASLLCRSLSPYAKAHGLGRVMVEMLFRIDVPTNLQRRPDLAYLSYERWPRGRQVPDEAAWDIVPDLAVEIVSPTNSANEVMAKGLEYFQAGVRGVWVIYPRLSLVYLYDSPTTPKVLRPGDEIDGGAILPGFRLPVATLFEDDTR
ncbi:Uma2 family endonuclease [Singulisphaera rosea]